MLKKLPQASIRILSFLSFRKMNDSARFYFEFYRDAAEAVRV
jgi:hypothetical protein